MKVSRERMPSQSDYETYIQSHPFKNVPLDWVCPGCGRTLFEVMHWALRWIDHKYPYEWWIINLHRHHDHSAGYEDRLYGWIDGYGFNGGRFQDTIVCDHCNAVDAQVKRRYTQIPQWFSFSPQEIRKIVFSSAHRSHRINYGMAWCVYSEITPKRRIYR